MGFVEYCVANYRLDIDLYGGNKLVRAVRISS